MKKNLLLFLCVAAIAIHSCDKISSLTASEIIEKSIIAHGANLLTASKAEFTFRGDTFMASRDQGSFEYAKIQIKDSLIIMDRLDNNSTARYINNQLQQLPDSLLNLYGSSVNSVIYFAQLPYSLDGKAVYKELIGETAINDQQYYKIKVTFDENGGGEDHDDVFVYWINKQSFMVDYLAYSYCEEECGYRFRESVNRRTINGVTIQDYNNYKETIQNPDLSKMDELFKNDRLELLSEIKLEAVKIDLKTL